MTSRSAYPSGDRGSWRRTTRTMAALLVAAVACTPGTAGPPASVPRALRSTFVERACALPRAHLLRIWRGYYPGRSGQIQLIPRQPDLIGDWLPHAGPWAYLQRVPMLLYGPGHVPSVGRVERPVTMADLAPTLAAQLRFHFPAPDGRAMIEPTAPGTPPPRLILVVVWDGGGRDVLAAHPRAWPVLRSLIGRGAWFEHATVGSSPSLTGAIHATLGTGAFPRRHGRIDHWIRLRGEVREILHTGMREMRLPTLAEAWDEATRNRAKVGVVAAETWHLGMIGQGARRPGGDRDVAVIDPAGGWSLPPEIRGLYRSPGAVDGVRQPEAVARGYDLEDGRADARWNGRRDVLNDAAFIAYQTRVTETLLAGERFGADRVPDLMFVNYKPIDRIAHIYTLNSDEMGLMLREADRSLGALVRGLDRIVGPERWVLAMTADHGSSPDPALTGAFEVSTGELRADVMRMFDGDGDDRPVVEVVRSTQMWLDTGELRSHGFMLDEVATYLSSYTKGENRGDPSAVPGSVRDDHAFLAAFPSGILRNLPCLPAPAER